MKVFYHLNEIIVYPRPILKMFKRKYLVHYIVLVSFFSDPYIWLLAFTSNYRVINIILIAVSVFFLLNKKVTWGQRDELWFGSFLLVFIFILAHAAYFGDRAEVIQGIGYLSKILFLFVMVYFIKNNGIKLLNLFFQYNIVMIIAGIILFFLLLVGIQLPYIQFSQGATDMFPADTNWLYPLGLVNGQTYIGSIIFTRVGGLTDEPGQLALLITWLLILNEFTLKSVKYRKYLLIGGIFTFSVAYFIFLILFALYFVFQSKYKSAVIKYSIISLIIILFIFSLLPGPIKNVVYSRTIERLILTEGEGSQKFEGDNRSEAFAVYFKDVVDHNAQFFGYGFTEAQERGNPKLFAVYGFLGLFFIYFPLIFLLFSKRVKLKYKYLLLIIVINFIQRPGIHYIFQMMVLTFMYYSPVIRNNLEMETLKKS